MKNQEEKCNKEYNETLEDNLGAESAYFTVRFRSSGGNRQNDNDDEETSTIPVKKRLVIAWALNRVTYSYLQGISFLTIVEQQNDMIRHGYINIACRLCHFIVLYE